MFCHLGDKTYRRKTRKSNLTQILSISFLLCFPFFYIRIATIALYPYKKENVAGRLLAVSSNVMS